MPRQGLTVTSTSGSSCTPAIDSIPGRGSRNKRRILASIPDNAATAEGGPATYSFNWTWDPGTGKATGDFNGTAFTLFAQSQDLNNTYDRFGFGGIPANGNRIQAFFDDLTYTTDFTASAATEWNVNKGGEWLNSGNWSAQAPNAVDVEADFLGAISGPHSVIADGPVKAGIIKFDNANSYVLSGSGSLTMDVSSGTAQFIVLQGSHTVNLPLFLRDNTVASVSAGATLTIADRQPWLPDRL